LTKSGMRSGDVLILTKRLGVGAILAANMRVQAEGRWVNQAIQTMLQSNAGAVQIFQQHAASACTDVTGFGLAGHLLEMLGSSNLCAKIDVAALPILPGTLETMSRGIFSSLHEQNARVIQSIATAGELGDKLRIQAMFDPQTSGGLLVSVNSTHVQNCLSQLKEAGYVDAAVIGAVYEDAASPNKIMLN